MDLFTIVNGRLEPSIHALMIEPFKGIWNNDAENGYENARKVFEYIELMCSPKRSNIYFKYTDVELREKRVKAKIFGDENYDTTTDMLLGVMAYQEELKDDAISYGLFIDATSGAEKLRQWLRDFDLNERTPNGAMVLKPADVTKALKEVPDLMKKLEESRRQIVTELDGNAKTRNDRETGHFER